jgi:hypothetical protein
MRGRKRIYGVYSSIILLFIIFGFQLLDSSAMPQQARDGDELMNMIVDEEDWKLLLCLVGWDKKERLEAPTPPTPLLLWKKKNTWPSCSSRKSESQLLFEFSLPAQWKFFIIKFPRDQKKKIYWQYKNIF